MQEKLLSINKIGHPLHDLDPVFERFSCDLSLVDALVWQPMYILKQAGIGATMRWHQDATIEHGCPWVEPGGHRGPMRERFVCNGEEIRMEKLDSTPSPYDSVAVPLEANAGSLVASTAFAPLQRAEPIAGVAPRVHAACDRWPPRSFAAEFDLAGCSTAGARV